MGQPRDDEPLLPPWIASLAMKVGPVLALIGIWWFLTSVLKLNAKIMAPALVVLVVSLAVFLGGRFYKPFYVEKGTGRCIAKSAKERMACRRYMPGAKIGGGCGRQREDRRCRYVR